MIDVFDIGAMLEGEERYSALTRANMSRVTAVEPNPTKLQELRRQRPDVYRFIPYFLGNGEPATVYVTLYPGCASLLEPDPRVIDRFMSISAVSNDGNFRVIRTEAVKTVRIDDLAPPVEADYIKIDVQGSELDILRHAEKLLPQVAIIECEVEFLPIYKNQPLFGDIQVFLRGKGFHLHKMVDVGSRCFRPLDFANNRFAGMSQMLWADAIFVRDLTDLENYDDEMILKTALILHEVYESYDAVFALLNEDDRRTGSGSVRRYAERLLSFPERPRWLLNLKERA